MTETTPITRQRGVALVLALLLLFVLVTIGVAGFGNTHLQERSASNARLQAEAFKAASAGATNAINWFQDNRDRTDIGIPDTLCGASGHTGWYDADDNPVATNWVSAGTIGQASLEHRMYCLADAYPCNEDVDVDCSIVARPPRSQLFVQSRGQVKVDGKVVAHRDVEVRLAKGQDGDPGDGCGAICFPGCDINSEATEFPTSNAFQVDGNDGPAITVGCNEGAQDILAEIRDNRIGNYNGGVGASDSGEPWNEPLSVEEFRTAVEAAALAAQTQGCGNCYHDSGDPLVPTIINGNTEFGSSDPWAPQITYFEGTADIGGSISGAGILLVNGDLIMNGPPAFQGLIVVLGGEWIIDGGGQGGNPGQQSEFGGSIVVLNVQDDGTFGEITFNNDGGGNALYRYDCTMLNAARELLYSASGYSNWVPECEGVPDIFILGPERIIIASWRENIGWREELFAD